MNWLMLLMIVVLLVVIAKLWAVVYRHEKAEQQAEPCLVCGRPGCDGSLAQCPGRWV